MNGPRSPAISPRVRALSGLFLAVAPCVFGLQSITSMSRLSATSDEGVHLAAGYAMLRTGRVLVNPEHPPLVKELAALPLLGLPINDAALGPDWQTSPPEQTELGLRLLYEHDADTMLWLARLPVVGISLLLGVIVFSWAFERDGPAGAVVATVLWAFSPSLLAHSHLVTMDAALTTFGTLALYGAWRFSRTGGLVDAAMTGIGLGLALASKFSAVFTVVSIGVLTLASVFVLPPVESRTQDPLAARVRAVAVGMAIVGVVAAAVLWAAYLFPADPLFYVEGVLQVNANHNPNVPGYLLGEFQTEAWWYYFLAAFLFKTPVPTIILLVVALGSMVMQKRDWVLDEWFLLLPILVAFASPSLLASNIGHRYVLPVYPLVFVLIGRLGPLLVRARAGRLLGLLLAGWYAVGALRIFPNHLAYFSEIAGGPELGYEVLADSSVEWGEGLLFLREWIQENDLADFEIALDYPWVTPPGYYGICHRGIPPRELHGPPGPGIYVISTHNAIFGRHAVELARARGLRSGADWIDRYPIEDRIGYSFFVFAFDRPGRPSSLGAAKRAATRERGNDQPGSCAVRRGPDSLVVERDAKE